MLGPTRPAILAKDLLTLSAIFFALLFVTTLALLVISDYALRNVTEVLFVSCYCS